MCGQRSKKKAFLIGISALLTILLAACGKKTDDAVPEKVFGVNYTEELDRSANRYWKRWRRNKRR